ncbi:MAG TPA: carbohydrate ABC transporter permease [Firmicutes bacterium]|nr:carbohydrate ABC transporter permease [Bacillota bacterium]
MKAWPLRRLAGGLAVYLGAALVFAFAVFPFLWMLTTSLKPNEEIFTRVPRLFPAHWSFEHYLAVFQRGGFARYFANSAIVAVCTTLTSIAVGSLAAYALARFRFPLRSLFLVLILSVQMFPLVVLIIPLFIIMRNLGLLDHYLGLILAYVTFTLPFGVWMLKGFFDSIPASLEEAAMIDGCSRMGAFLRVILPVAAPGVAASSIYSFIGAWNEFMFAMTFINKEEMRTLPLALQAFFGQFTVEWGPVMAASVVFTLPVLVFFLAVQKRLTTGLVKGAVKG